MHKRRQAPSLSLPRNEDPPEQARRRARSPSLPSTPPNGAGTSPKTSPKSVPPGFFSDASPEWRRTRETREEPRARELPSLGSQGRNPRSGAVDDAQCPWEGSRQPSPLDSTQATASSHSSRRSSSCSTRNSASQASEAVAPNLSGHRPQRLDEPHPSTQLPYGGRKNAGSITPPPERSRRGSKGYDPDAGSMPRHSQSSSSSAAISDPPMLDFGLPLSRTGWGGGFDSEDKRAGYGKEAPRYSVDTGPLIPPPRRSPGGSLPPLQPLAGATPPSPKAPASPSSERGRRPNTYRFGDLSVAVGHGESDKGLREALSPMSPTSPKSPATRASRWGPSSPSASSSSKNWTRAEMENIGSGARASHEKEKDVESSSSPSLVTRSASSKMAARSNIGIRNPRHSLAHGSRDDSFLSTISESTFSSGESTSTDQNSRDSKTELDIEVAFESSASSSSKQRPDLIMDFHQLFIREGNSHADRMQANLREAGFDKPLDVQRRVLPLVVSAFRDPQKSFVTVQGAPQSGKTSALVLGIIGGVDEEMPGVRVVVLSTGASEDFRKSFDICAGMHPLRLECYEAVTRRVSFEGLPPDPDGGMLGVDPRDDLQRLATAQASRAPVMVFGHPSRVLPLLREAPSWGVDLSTVMVLALDDAEETIRFGLMDEVCEVCTILRHFSKHRLRHIILSQALTREAKSMIRCLQNSLLRQQNLFGIRAHKTQARAKNVNHYYSVAPRARWPAMLAALHNALSLPSGIVFDDASSEARAQARAALRAQGVQASVWNALQEQGSGARAAARDGAAAALRGPAFHIMPSDLVVLKVDLPQVRCVLHFEVPRQELSIYGLRLMCLEQQDQKKSSRKGTSGGKSLSVLFVEEEYVVRELEKTFHIRMQQVPTEMLLGPGTRGP
eukprot:TRINITY_DN75024_c0_g1_i1.p1 TRINITY_DN75024_c0_g1~~TRINITY_DN75024_c0_g1_i1.p1  ORF type:complete len:926 (-),score=141.33 TRINITY_DN75024_c0_g1_i1:45-2744(-)